MDKETLFKEIRQGRVLLWVGAGFSAYAEYPMGASVVRRLYEELSNAQRQELAAQLGQLSPECPNWTLPKFAQHFVDLHHGSRARLVEIIDNLFSADPTTIHVHEKLARIASIKHIVTTNYDPLFELAYKRSRIHVVEQDIHLPQVGNKDVTLYKIHGQPSSLKNLIITEDDYNGFFNDADELVWAHLRSLMSTQTIVFIGYAIEDPNLLFIFDGLVKKLGNLMKPAYVVGPYMDRVREERLLRNKIHYIKSNGEDFVNELWAYIQDTALSELPQDGLMSMAPVGQMLKNMGLDFTMNVAGDKPLINNLKRSNGVTETTLSFSSNSDEFHKTLERFYKGENLQPIRLDKANIQNLSYRIEGFKMPVDDFSAIWFTKAPNWEGVIDMRLNSKMLIPGVLVWTYNGEDVVYIVGLTSVSRIEIKIPKPTEHGPEYIVKVDPRFKKYANLREAEEHTYLLQTLAKGQLIELFLNGQQIWRSREFTLATVDDIIHKARIVLVLIEDLKTVEAKLGILFKYFSIDEIEVRDLSDMAVLLGDTPRMEKSNKEYSAVINTPTIAELAIISNKKNGRNITVGLDTEEVKDFEVLGYKFQLRWKQRLHILQPIFRKMSKGSYMVKSRAGEIAIEPLTVYEQKVISSPVLTSPNALTFEETLQERLPHKKS